MRTWIAVAFCCALGCGGSSSKQADLSQPKGDLAGSTSRDLSSPAKVDLAQATSADAGGKLPFGAACTKDNDCATGSCFIGGMMSFCTMPCTAATQATDCPAPPTSGTCNMRGFCKP